MRVLVQSVLRLEDLADVFPLCEAGRSVFLCTDRVGRPASGFNPLAFLEAGQGDAPFLWTRSSGTTRLPSPSRWSWKALKASVSAHAGMEGWTWSSCFDASSFAGIQVGLQAWATGGKAVSLPRDARGALRLLKARRVEALCCTPTFLSMLLMEPSLVCPGSRDWAPRQITVGGEPLLESLGLRCQDHFPSARMTNVYAASEHGVLLKSNRWDGWFEMPVGPRNGETLRVCNGLLYIGRGRRWFSTGDLVERRGGLVRILGRGDRVANVGGHKVSLAVVEAVAGGFPGVEHVVARAVKNSVVGEIVGLRVRFSLGKNFDASLAGLQDFCRRQLPRQAWPRQWEPAEVGMGANGKALL